MGSVVEAVMANESGGLSDLTVIWMVSVCFSRLSRQVEMRSTDHERLVPGQRP
jgi:hypothetical protein